MLVLSLNVMMVGRKRIESRSSDAAENCAAAVCMWLQEGGWWIGKNRHREFEAVMCVRTISLIVGEQCLVTFRDLDGPAGPLAPGREWACSWRSA